MSLEKIKINALIASDKGDDWERYSAPQHIKNWNFSNSTWYLPSEASLLEEGGKYKTRLETKNGSFGFDFEAVYTNKDFENSLLYEFDGRMAKIHFKEIENHTDVNISFDPETENPIELQRESRQAILNYFKNSLEKKA